VNLLLEIFFFLLSAWMVNIIVNKTMIPWWYSCLFVKYGEEGTVKTTATKNWFESKKFFFFLGCELDQIYTIKIKETTNTNLHWKSNNTWNWHVPCRRKVGIEEDLEQCLSLLLAIIHGKAFHFGHRHLGAYSYSSIREDQTKNNKEPVKHRLNKS